MSQTLASGREESVWQSHALYPLGRSFSRAKTIENPFGDVK